MPCCGRGQPGLGAAPGRTRRAPRRGGSPPGEVPTIGTPASCERLREPERRLAAELDDDARRPAPAALLGVHDLEHVLERERLEVEPVGGVVVGGDGLRVAVDHDGLVARPRAARSGVHAGVVELDALPDPVRPGAEDDHRRPLARRDLGLLVVGRVVVRRARGELGGAGVDGLVDRADARARAARRGRRPRACRGSAPICASENPCRLAARSSVGGRARRGRATSRGDLVDAARSGRGTTGRCSVASCTCSTVAPARSACWTSRSRPSCGTRDLLEQRRRRRRRRARRPSWKPASWLLQRAQRLLQRLGEVAADRHRLADATSSCVVSVGSAAGNFSKANRGTLTTT